MCHKLDVLLLFCSAGIIIDLNDSQIMIKTLKTFLCTIPQCSQKVQDTETRYNAKPCLSLLVRKAVLTKLLCLLSVKRGLL